MPASLLRTIGYLISTLSVLLLGLVAWTATADDVGLRAALLVGMAASIAGMVLRWLSYKADEREQATPPQSARTRPNPSR